MNAFIQSVTTSLQTMQDIRAGYLSNKENLPHTESNYKIHNRIFQIYSVDTPNSLTKILYQLELIESEEYDGQHDVRSVLLNFCHNETQKQILMACNKHCSEKQIQDFQKTIEALAKEMRDRFNDLLVAT